MTSINAEGHSVEGHSVEGTGLPWTTSEIRQRLGVSTVAFKGGPAIGAREIAAIRKVGITRIEITAIRSPISFDLRNRNQIREIIEECRKQDVSVVSVHGPRGSYDSEDEQVRRAAAAEALLAAKVAEELGASLLLCHFGTNQYAERTVTDMLESLNSSTLKLAVENGASLPDHLDLVDRIGSDNFGLVVDIGHAHDPDGVNPFIKKRRAREVMVECGKRLIHVHLYDVAGHGHIVPMDGKIEWAEIFAAFRDMGYPGTFMFEAAYPAHDREPSPQHVLEKTAAFPESFIQRYYGGSEDAEVDNDIKRK